MDTADAYLMSVKLPYSRPMDLTSVAEAKVGNMQHLDELRLFLTDVKGRQLAVPTLENMEEFIEEVERHIPVELERVNQDLPRRTRADWLLQCSMWATLAILMLGVYFLSQWWYGD